MITYCICLQIQCNPYPNTNDLFHRTRTKDPKICMEIQNMQSNLEKERSWRYQAPWVWTILQSYSNKTPLYRHQNRCTDQWKRKNFKQYSANHRFWKLNYNLPKVEPAPLLPDFYKLVFEGANIYWNFICARLCCGGFTPLLVFTALTGHEFHLYWNNWGTGSWKLLQVAMSVYEPPE